MSVRLIINPLAVADFDEAVAWLDGRRSGLGSDFLNEVSVAFDRISRSPLLHAIQHRDLRATPVKRFQYAIWYRVDSDQVTVVAVYHTSRHPRAWQQRESP